MPYFFLLKNAAWSIQQNLESLNVIPSMTNSFLPGIAHPVANFDPQGSVNIILGILGFACIFIFYFFFLASYALLRFWGILVFFILLLLPGFLVLFGSVNVLQSFHIEYSIGKTGKIGEVWGALPLLLLGTTLGWSLMTLLANHEFFKKNYWDIYDIFWLPTGMVAALLFFLNTESTAHKLTYQENELTMQNASSYLLKQTESYEKWCSNNIHKNISSCRWASNIQPLLIDLSYQNLVEDMNFRLTKKALYGNPNQYYDVNTQPATEQEILAIRTEVRDYNRSRCIIRSQGGVTVLNNQNSSDCEITPAPFCSIYPPQLPGYNPYEDNGLLIPQALSIDCIVPKLVALSNVQHKLYIQNQADARRLNLYWLYYLFFFYILRWEASWRHIKILSNGCT